MSTYRSVLPSVFPFVVQVPEDYLSRCVRVLNEATDEVPNGSSYAVTSDAPEGYRYLWLSRVSRMTLESLPSWSFTIMKTNQE